MPTRSRRGSRQPIRPGRRFRPGDSCSPGRLADRWHFIDNSDLAAGMRPVASGGREQDEVILDATRWKAIRHAQGSASVD